MGRMIKVWRVGFINLLKWGGYVLGEKKVA